MLDFKWRKAFLNDQVGLYPLWSPISFLCRLLSPVLSLVRPSCPSRHVFTFFPISLVVTARCFTRMNNKTPFWCAYNYYLDDEFQTLPVALKSGDRDGNSDNRILWDFSTDWIKLLTSKILESSHVTLLRPMKSKLLTDLKLSITKSVTFRDRFFKTICINPSIVSKVGDRIRGWLKGSLFGSYYTEV